AHAILAATLEPRRQHDIERIRTRARERNLRFDVVVVHLDVAEILVLVRLALRQRRFAKLDLAVDTERELVAIKIMVRRDLPADRELVRLVEARVQHERLIAWQETRGRRADLRGW